MTRINTLVMTRKKALVRTRSKITKSQLRPPAPGNGHQAPGKDLVIDQATLLPGSRLVSTKSGTTEIGQGRRKDRKEPKPEESHYPLVSGQDLMPRARAAKAKTKAKEKEKKKESRTKESRAKAKVSQAKGEVARHPHPLHAKDLQQPWWNQGTASSLQMSRNTRTTVRKRKVPRQRPE